MAYEQIAFIGAGQMARALAAGFVEAGLVRGEQISASDPSPAALEEFAAAAPGASVADDNAAAVKKCDVVFLAVKPQQMAPVMEEIRPAASAEKLFVSIAAGVRLAALTEGLTADRVIRVMPNTPCMVGQSAAGYCLAPGATEDDGQFVGRLLESVGVAYLVPERLMDAVTGLSGSGPAFVYLVIEALSDGGVKMGLPRDTATALAAQTVRGAAEMVLKTGEHPAVLKDRVTSPGGTTIAGIAALEEGGLRAALIEAVESATCRSVELGNG